MLATFPEFRGQADEGIHIIGEGTILLTLNIMGYIIRGHRERR
jgi:hypothetical protein